MALDGAAAERELLPDLDRGQALQDQVEHFRFASAERFVAPANVADGNAVFEATAGGFDRLPDAVDEILIAEGLAKDVDRAALQTSNGRRELGKRRDQDRRGQTGFTLQLLDELETAHPAQAHVQDEAGDFTGVVDLEKLRCRGMNPGLEPHGLDEPTQCLSHRGIVVDDVYGTFGRHIEDASTEARAGTSPECSNAPAALEVAEAQCEGFPWQILVASVTFTSSRAMRSSPRSSFGAGPTTSSTSRSSPRSATRSRRWTRSPAAARSSCARRESTSAPGRISARTTRASRILPDGTCTTRRFACSRRRRRPSPPSRAPRSGAVSDSRSCPTSAWPRPSPASAPTSPDSGFIRASGSPSRFPTSSANRRQWSSSTLVGVSLATKPSQWGSATGWCRRIRSAARPSLWLPRSPRPAHSPSRPSARRFAAASPTGSASRPIARRPSRIVYRGPKTSRGDPGDGGPPKTRFRGALGAGGPVVAPTTAHRLGRDRSTHRARSRDV